jgi:hypothetical protein
MVIAAPLVLCLWLPPSNSNEEQRKLKILDHLVFSNSEKLKQEENGY